MPTYAKPNDPVRSGAPISFGESFPTGVHQGWLHYRIDLGLWHWFTGLVWVALQNALGSQSYTHVSGASGLTTWYAAGSDSDISYIESTPNVNNIRAIPFIAPSRGGAIDGLRFHVTAGISNIARIGVYSNTSPSNLYPKDLLFSSAEFAAVPPGAKEATISPAIAFDPGGLYWFVHWSGVLSASIMTLQAGAGGPTLGGNAVAINVNRNIGLIVVHNWTGGALPAAFPAGANYLTALGDPATSFAPVIECRFSA